MGLSADIAKAAQDAIKATGDIAKAVTYVSITIGDYDATADVISTTEVEYSLSALVAPFGSGLLGSDKTEHLESNTSDLSVFFAAADLPVIPQSGDQIIYDSVRYKTVQIRGDISNATWRIIMERIG